MKNRYNSRASILFPIIALQVITSVYFFTVPPAGDEAIHIYNSIRVHNGLLPHRDFFSYLTPATYYIGGLVAHLPLPEVYSLRLLAILLTIATFYTHYKLTIERMTIKTGVPLALLIYSGMGLSSYYFSHHTIDNFLFIVFAYIVLKERENKNFAYIISIVLFFASLTHQLHGFLYFFTVVLILAIEREFRPIKKIVIILTVAYVPILYFYIKMGMLNDFFNQAILWNIQVYSKVLSFGPFEDNWHALNNSELFNIEALITLAIKIIIFASIPLLAIQSIINRESRNKNLLIIFYLLGKTNTMYSYSTYAVAVTAASIYLYNIDSKKIGKKLIFIFCILLSVQFTRVVTFPFRYFNEIEQSVTTIFNSGHSNLSAVRPTEEVKKIIQLIKALNRDEIAIIGRSVEFYIYSNARNPTEFDVAIPLYLSRDQEKDFLNQIENDIFIYDGFFETVLDKPDFFDAHHYLKNGELKDEIVNSKIKTYVAKFPVCSQIGKYSIRGVCD